MKYITITLFLAASMTMFAQKMTKDYGYIVSKDSKFPKGSIYIGAVVSVNSWPDYSYIGSSTRIAALKLVYNTEEFFFPLTIGRAYGQTNNVDFTFGAGYRKQFRKMFLHSSSNIRYTTHDQSVSEYFGLGLNFGITREFGNNLILTGEFGRGIYRHTYPNKNRPPDPVTFMYPLQTISTWLTNTAFTLAYRI